MERSSYEEQLIALKQPNPFWIPSVLEHTTGFAVAIFMHWLVFLQVFLHQTKT